MKTRTQISANNSEIGVKPKETARLLLTCPVGPAAAQPRLLLTQHTLLRYFQSYILQESLNSPQVLDLNVQNYSPRIESLAFIDPVATLQNNGLAIIHSHDIYFNNINHNELIWY